LVPDPVAVFTFYPLIFNAGDSASAYCKYI